MTKKFHITEKIAPGGFHVLEMDAEPFKGIQWTYGEMKFGEKENEDGSATLSFDYDIVSDHKLSEENSAEFGQLLGGFLVEILEEQVARGEVQYSGGTDEPAS